MLFRANANGANVIRPYGEYNLSDCHLVGLFTLILPSLIICVEFDCDECDWGECYLGECDSPLREYNLSDCHFVGLFSLILPPLIVCVEFDCDECDCGECYLGECDWGECDSPLREYNSSDCHFVGLFSLILPSFIICVEFDCD